MEIQDGDSVRVSCDKLQSVSIQIINTFITELSTKYGFEDISKRLKLEIVDKGCISETAIRKALFGDDQS